jgi:hypothetical protein
MEQGESDLYWSRTGSYLDVLIWLVLSALWGAGGWLLAVNLFRSQVKESGPIGLAIGLTIFITLTNLFTNFIPLTAAYWISSLLLALSGIAFWLRERRQIHPPGPLLDASKGWRYLLVLLLLTVLFTAINRGLSIFDDYHNLPLVSTIATGDAPPHFYLDPQYRLAFHYGLDLFAAGTVVSLQDQREVVSRSNGSRFPDVDIRWFSAIRNPDFNHTRTPTGLFR